MPPIIHLKEIDSTNNYLKALINEQEVEEGTVVYTDYQTSGKGQRGNSWESEEDTNLLFSLVLFPTDIKANEQFIISQIVSLAIKKVLDKYTKDVTIKWPNDIYYKDAKLAGILIENALMGDSIKHSIIGIGLNINQTIFKSDAPNPISLKNITTLHHNKLVILNEISEGINTLYNSLNTSKAQTIDSYKENLYRRHGYHLYNDGKSNFSARLIDIMPSGILVLETEDGEIREFAFKEVKYIL